MRTSIASTGVVSFTNPPVISRPGPEINGPPPLTLGKEVELCWQSILLVAVIALTVACAGAVAANVTP